MSDEWKPDIVDYNVFDKDKAEHIHKTACQYLEATVKISDTLDDKAFKLLRLLVTAIAALMGFVLFKCDFAAFNCTAGGGNVFWPTTILFAGLLASGLVLTIGCVKPKPYDLVGNQPRNLLRNDLCGMETPLMKISETIDMEHRINNNLHNLSRTSKRLKWSILVAFSSFALSLCVGFASATSSLSQTHQTSPSQPSAGFGSAR